MIRATFKWMTTGETGTILEWYKPGVHLTPYHLSIIRNTAFMEFNPEERAVSCIIEKDGAEVATYLFYRIPDENIMMMFFKNLASGKVIRKFYDTERCL